MDSANSTIRPSGPTLFSYSYSKRPHCQRLPPSQCFVQLRPHFHSQYVFRGNQTSEVRQSNANHLGKKCYESTPPAKLELGFRGLCSKNNPRFGKARLNFFNALTSSPLDNSKGSLLDYTAAMEVLSATARSFGSRDWQFVHKRDMAFTPHMRDIDNQ